MEFLIIIAVIAGICGFIWLQGAATKGLNRAFQHTNHQKGRRLLSEELSLDLPTMPLHTVIDAIVAELNVYDAPSTLQHRAYVTRLDPSRVAVSHGNKVVTNWVMEVIAVERESGGVTVFALAVDATEVNGVVQGARELGLVHERVKTAVAKLVPQVNQS